MKRVFSRFGLFMTTTNATANRLPMPLYTQVLIAVIFGGLLGVIFGQEPYLGGITNAQLGKLGMVVVQLLRRWPFR